MKKQHKKLDTKKAWRKPVLVVHGGIMELTKAKNPGGTDSGLGTSVS